VKYCIEMVAIS